MSRPRDLASAVVEDAVDLAVEVVVGSFVPLVPAAFELLTVHAVAAVVVEAVLLPRALAVEHAAAAAAAARTTRRAAAEVVMRERFVAVVRAGPIVPTSAKPSIMAIKTADAQYCRCGEVFRCARSIPLQVARLPPECPHVKAAQSKGASWTLPAHPDCMTTRVRR